MTDPPEPGAAATAVRRRRTLPVGPVGLLLATAVAIAAAYGVLYLFAAATTDDAAVEVQAALDGLSTGPVVPEGTEPVTVGDPAPDVRLDGLDGSTGQLSDLRGTPVVVNFWSSTCAPCLEEMPAFEAVSQQTAGRVTFLGVDVADTVADGRAMVERTGVTYRNARDPRSEILAAFGGTALPRTVLLDADGTVVATHSGALDEAELVELLREQGFT